MKVPATFLVVRIRLRRWKVGLLFPVPLFVLEDAAEAGALLASAGMRVGRWLGRRSVNPPGRYKSLGHLAPHDSWEEWQRVVYLPLAAVRALRSYGRLTVADLRHGKAYVTVRLV